ncbi:MAG: copper homeostasis protein CutC [Rikenellaceae bacterium]|nr:copper homeostasis protein CutC [Rikenellaceae bacterium]
MALLEVCAESIDSALTAERCGAARIEFCDNMHEGGTTPSAGNITILRDALNIELFPIIRPRGGDFVYTDREFEAMLEDVRFCGRTGCDGIVTGVLTPEGAVDTARCRELAALAASLGMKAAFHRAFDVCGDPDSALEDIIGIGFIRILTSGGAAAAPEGVTELRRLVQKAAGRIAIMPGGGVTPENAAGILHRTGCREIHGTFSSRYESPSPGPVWANCSRRQADPVKIRKVYETIKDL